VINTSVYFIYNLYYYHHLQILSIKNEKGFADIAPKSNILELSA